MTRPMTQDPPTDGGYPLDSDLHQMTDDGGPHAPDPARWTDPDWRDGRGEWDAFADEVPREPMPTSDTASDWTPIAVAMPPEGVFVDTITSNGRRLRVKWEGRLWRLQSGVHYPCFTPQYWRLETPAVAPPAAVR